MIRPRLRAALLWGAVLASSIAVMWSVRASLDEAHVALVLLLVVLGGSSAGGRVLGLALSAVSFLAFNWFFLPPFGTFSIDNPLDWLVLVAFLVTSIVAAQLLYLSQEKARAAQERAAEIDRLASLGAEALSVGSAVESLEVVAQMVRRSADATRCEVYAVGPPAVLVAVDNAGHESDSPAAGDTVLVESVLASGDTAAVGKTGVLLLETIPSAEQLATLRSGAISGLVLPLHARDRTVGAVRIASERGLRIDETRWRFLRAMSYYVALAVERVRLVAESERAEALRQSEALKDALLAAVSHDLRTPLTAIKALAHDLGQYGDERSEIIEQETDRLSRSVADLLDLSRLDAGAMPVRIELNAVDDLLGALVQRVEPALGPSRLLITLPQDDVLLLGQFDFVHSLRILANLVENAARYSPPGSPIHITASRAGEDLVIEVRDHGPGLPAQDVERVFEAFYRPPSTAPDIAGAGLGLSIARRLAAAQGGSLGYRPARDGGSVMVLRLRAADAATSD